jgi:FKBP-type peptidyl-prolyl cis-trans isomerase
MSFDAAFIPEGNNPPVAPAEGQLLEFHYKLALKNGTFVESSVKRERPVRFRLGRGKA